MYSTTNIAGVHSKRGKLVTINNKGFEHLRICHFGALFDLLHLSFCNLTAAAPSDVGVLRW